MMTFVMLTQLEGMDTPQALEDREKKVMGTIEKECPDVEWLQSYAVLGPYEYLDIFRAEDAESATKVSTLVRTFGHAHTQVWPATEWSRYKDIIHSLPREARV